MARSLPEFLQVFSVVMQSFGDRKFPTIVLERMNEKTHDLSYLELKDLCELLLDKCEHAPKTSKVIEFAHLIRAKRLQKAKDYVYSEVECTVCGDLGIVQTFLKDESKATLMFCDCKSGHGQLWELKRWERSDGEYWERVPCPATWFKPDSPLDKGKVTYRSLTRKLESWRKRVHEAEDFWALALNRKVSRKRVPHSNCLNEALA